MPVSNAPPFVSLYIFAILNRVLFHLLDVSQLSCSISVPNALIVTCVERVTLLKRSKQWLLLYLLLLLWEGDLCAEGREATLKTTSLAHSIRPGLVAVEDQGVAMSVLSPAQILLPLVRVLCIANRSEVGEGFVFDAGGESGRRLLARSPRWTQWHVYKLRFTHLFIAGSDEGSHWRFSSA